MVESPQSRKTDSVPGGCHNGRNRGTVNRPAADLTSDRRDACAVERHLDGIACVAHRDTARIGASANHERRVHLNLVGAYRSRIDARRGDVGQRMSFERGVVALRQYDEAVAADLLLDCGRERTRRRGVSCRASALKNQIRVVGDLRRRRYRRGTQVRALDRLVRVEVVHSARRAVPAQEHGEHAVVAAVRRTAEHAAVDLLQVVDVP